MTHGPVSATIVWIDSREAWIVHWPGGSESAEHFESDVPPHRRPSGTGQHDPGRSRAGGSTPQPPVEGRRLEHLARFVDQIAQRIPPADDVLILGPGTVREHLWRELNAADEHAHRARHVAMRPSPPLTLPQLVAELRADVGDAPPRKPITRRRRVERRPARNETAELTHIEEEL